MGSYVARQSDTGGAATMEGQPTGNHGATTEQPRAPPWETTTGATTGITTGATTGITVPTMSTTG